MNDVAMGIREVGAAICMVAVLFVVGYSAIYMLFRGRL